MELCIIAFVEILRLLLIWHLYNKHEDWIMDIETWIGVLLFGLYTLNSILIGSSLLQHISVKAGLKIRQKQNEGENEGTTTIT